MSELCKGCPVHRRGEPPNPAEPEHGCAYQEDVNEDKEFRCNCCDECAQECSAAI